MQTILGAGGQIADELARELHAKFTHDIRLVSRHPRKVNETDELVAADLMDSEQTSAAVAGSEVVYLTVGLPADSALWEQRFPVMMANVIAACEQHGARLVFFDNTYMYPRTSVPQTEETAFEPDGRKASVRAHIATMVLEAMHSGQLQAVICRAPEFYGPGNTQSYTNSLIFDRVKKGKRALVPLSATTLRSLIWTPDASRAMALIGNTPEAFGQTWHLPIDEQRLTYQQMIESCSEVLGRKVRYIVIPRWLVRFGSRFSSQLKEAAELLARYGTDNVFVSTKFAERFPDFRVTTYREGITDLLTTPS